MPWAVPGPTSRQATRMHLRPATSAGPVLAALASQAAAAAPPPRLREWSGGCGLWSGQVGSLGWAVGDGSLVACHAHASCDLIPATLFKGIGRFFQEMQSTSYEVHKAQTCSK